MLGLFNTETRPMIGIHFALVIVIITRTKGVWERYFCEMQWLFLLYKWRIAAHDIRKEDVVVILRCMVTGHSMENRYHLLPEKNIPPTC